MSHEVCKVQFIDTLTNKVEIELLYTREKAEHMRNRYRYSVNRNDRIVGLETDLNGVGYTIPTNADWMIKVSENCEEV